MDSVLSAQRPRLTEDDAAAIGATTFGAGATGARDLGSERDRTFALLGDAGDPVAILKVSNASEDPAVLDMEAAIALHVTAVDPGLRVALPCIN
jgi:Ser/Thr protein kinase RdoA (MazF antagonist)